MFRQHPEKNCSGCSAVKPMLQFSSMSFITQKKTYSCPNPGDCMMSSMKFWLKLSPQYRLLTGNSMEYRQVPILIRLPSSVWWLNKIVPLLILLLRYLFPVRKNKASSSLIFTFRSFSKPDVMSIWINSFKTPLSTSF